MRCSFACISLLTTSKVWLASFSPITFPKIWACQRHFLHESFILSLYMWVLCRWKYSHELHINEQHESIMLFWIRSSKASKKRLLCKYLVSFFYTHTKEEVGKTEERYTHLYLSMNMLNEMKLLALWSGYLVERKRKNELDPRICKSLRNPKYTPTSKGKDSNEHKILHNNN